MRFEIPAGWDKEKLGDIANVQTGIAKGSKNVSDPITRPYLRVANVQDGHLDLKEMKTIQVSRKKLDRYSLQDGDVLFTEGGDFDKLGRGTVWRGEVDGCLHQNHVFAVRIRNGQMLPEFLAAYAASFQGRMYFLSCSKQTTNLASINSTQLKQMPLPVPPHVEQQKIVAVLSTWDRAVELTEKLIAAKQKRKQALMQQLLTGTIRFNEFDGKPWKEIKLDKLLTVRNEQIENDGTHPLYSLTIENGVTPKTERYNREFLVRDKASKKYKVVYPGDIVFNPSNLRWGAIGIHNGAEPVLVSPIYEVLYVTDEEATDKAFLFQQLSSSRQIRLFSGMAEGTLVERTAVKLPTFMICKVLMPPTMDEQSRVAGVFDAADLEINIISQRRAALKHQKKGFMQQLLTGKVRVTADVNEKAPAGGDSDE